MHDDPSSVLSALVSPVGKGRYWLWKTWDVKHLGITAFVNSLIMLGFLSLSEHSSLELLSCTRHKVCGQKKREIAFLVVLFLESNQTGG